MKPSVDIVIVSWNAGAQLRECLDSVAVARQDGFGLARVCVVDNGSADGSVDGLVIPDLRLDVIRNPENRGFAAACNQGAAGSRSDYLLFLNPDARLGADSLARPLQFMEIPEHARVGTCGIQLVDGQGRVSRSCARFPTPCSCLVHALGFDRVAPGRFQSHVMAEWDHSSSRPVDHVIGAFFLVRRTVFEERRGFDERFFVYLEDLDFSLRASRAGWSCHYLAEAQAFHKGGGTSEQVRARRLFYALRSRLIYAFIHFGAAAAYGILGATLFLEPCARLVHALLRGSPAQAGETFAAYAMLWGALPEIPRILRKGRAP